MVAAKISPSSVNSVIGGSQNLTITAQDAYGNAIANQTIYLGTGVPGLWISQVNGSTITSSVNMGTTQSTSMQTVNTPIPLYTLTSNVPAYDSASMTGVTAYHLQTAPVVALTTGVDGTVSITLVDGNVTYVAETATQTATNSYAVDPGQNIGSKTLAFYSDNGLSSKLGSVLVNWGTNTPGQSVAVTGITVAGATSATTVVSGGTLQMSAAVSPTNATTPDVTWSVANGTGTATISTTGLLTATGVGTVTVTAKNPESAVVGTEVITVTAGTIVNPFTVAPKFNIFEIDGTLNLTDAATVKATGTEGTVTGVVSATGTFTISTSTFATEAVQVQAYNAQGTPVGSPVSVVVM